MPEQSLPNAFIFPIRHLEFWNATQCFGTMLGGHFKKWNHHPKSTNRLQNGHKFTVGGWDENAKHRLVWPQLDYVHHVTHFLSLCAYACLNGRGSAWVLIQGYKWFLTSRHIGKHSNHEDWLCWGQSIKTSVRYLILVFNIQFQTNRFCSLCGIKCQFKVKR